jgi:D-serine deaminase-like pyridoxal phosphate-dependent protein
MLSNETAREIARSYGTPAVAVDMDVVERNIARVQAMIAAKGLANRPHIKTHKSPEIAKMQVAAGAKGITCQKVGEAEVMAAAGLDDILIAYNIYGTEKTARLGRLLREGTRITVAVDNATVLDGLADAAREGGEIGVVIECDTGRKRAGVETPGEAVELAKRAAGLPGVAFRGFMLYPPEDRWPQTQRFFDEALAGVRAAGLEPEIVSTGGSPNIAHLGELKGATEHRPGTYVYNDRWQMSVGVAGLDDCALAVVSTVVSRAAPERGILDAGSKTLTVDPGHGLDGFGLILEHPEARIAGFAEEHGFLDLARTNSRPAVGDVVRIVPNHVCVVVNMVDEVVAVRGGEIAGVMPVAARGKLR